MTRLLAADWINGTADTASASSTETTIPVVAFVPGFALAHGASLRIRVCGPGVAALGGGFTGATATGVDSTRTLTQVGAFAGYTFAAGDKLWIVSGTNVIPGLYTVTGRDGVGNDFVTLDRGFGTNVAANIVWHLPAKETITWKLYRATPNSGTVTGVSGALSPVFTTYASAAGTTFQWEFEMNVWTSDVADPASALLNQSSRYRLTRNQDSADASQNYEQTFIARRAVACDISTDSKFYVTYTRAGLTSVASINPRWASIELVGAPNPSIYGL